MSIPESFLERLSGFVDGGYILAFVDAQGETIVINTFDHPTLEKGIRVKLREYLEFLDRGEQSAEFDNFISGMVDIDDADSD